MLTRETPKWLPRRNPGLSISQWVCALVLGVALIAVGASIKPAWCQPGDGDAVEYRIPNPGNAGDGRAHRQGGSGDTGNTDADPDEFSVNSVGVHHPDVAYQPISGGGTAGWLTHMRVSIFLLLRIWLTLGVGH